MTGLAIAIAVSFTVLASCAHPHRVSRSTVNRLTKSRETFVLVFGSVLPAERLSARPVIRFVHQSDKSAPEYLLHEMAISRGGRFYAVLKAPAALQRLDHFEAEVRWADASYDKFIYVRLTEPEGPTALYLGEIRISVAQNRTAPGRTTLVDVQDDFQTALQELRRLYSNFEGPIIRSPLLRNPAPATPKQAR